MNKFLFSSCPKWKDYVTPKLSRSSPFHSWLVFPHSYAGVLVHELVDKWKLDDNDRILDPFCGAGTTLLAAKELGIKATGYDISPYAVFVTNAKTGNYNIIVLERVWEEIKAKLTSFSRRKLQKTYPDLIQKAFSQEILMTIERVDEIISQFATDARVRLFFRLALFSTMPSVSNAQATGGWLKWVDNRKTSGFLLSSFIKKVEFMFVDVRGIEHPKVINNAILGDARCLDIKDGEFSTIITSPPYPNRHDYTRVFGVELMYGFLDWEGTRAVRYQSFHSHPESKPVRPKYDEYVQPQLLQNSLSAIKERCSERRIMTMLAGYFVDLYCSFREMSRVCAKGGNIALVLGNAQYYGEQLLVDEIAAHIGEQVGLRCIEIITTRIRGNSAQQMKKYGRNPSRESVILFKNKYHQEVGL